MAIDLPEITIPDKIKQRIEKFSQAFQDHSLVFDIYSSINPLQEIFHQTIQEYTLYAPKNPIPYENLEFEFDLKSGKPKTPVFELIFEGIARMFREVPMESRKYCYLDRENCFLYPYNPDEPIEFHDHYAVANYQYHCTIQYNERYSLTHGIQQHYELLLCVIGKNTYVFQ